MSDIESGPEQQGGDQDRGLGKELTNAVANLGAGEKFAVLGAAVLLGGWALFDLLLDEFGTGHLPFALAVVIVLTAYSHQQGKYADQPIPYKTLLFVCAGLLGLIGFWDLVDDLRNGILDADVTTILGAFIYYGGAIVSGVGALQLRST